MGGELVSCSKISLITDRAKSSVKDSEGNRVEEEDEEEEDKEVKNKKLGYIEENSCEKGKICYENEEEREKVRGTWGTDRKRDSEASKRLKLGGRWSNMGDEFEEEESRDRRSRSESDLLSDFSRSGSYHSKLASKDTHTRHLFGYELNKIKPMNIYIRHLYSMAQKLLKYLF